MYNEVGYCLIRIARTIWSHLQYALPKGVTSHEFLTQVNSPSQSVAAKLHMWTRAIPANRRPGRAVITKQLDLGLN